MSSPPEHPSKTDILERVVETYPGPIAAVAWQVQSLTSQETDVIPKHRRLLVLLETILEYTGFLLLSYHRQRLRDDGNVLPPMLESLRRPLLGQIRGLQRELAAALLADSQTPLLIRTLATYLAATKRDGPMVAAFAELQRLRGKPFGGQRIAVSDLLDALVAYRNWSMHDEGQLVGAAELAPFVPALEAVLLEVLSDLNFLVQHPLVFVESVVMAHDQTRHLQLRFCMGTSQRWKPLEVTADREVASGHCYICQINPDGTRTPVLDLHPLLLCTRCVREPGNRQQVFMLAGEEKGGIGKYRSYECSHYLPPEATEKIAEDMDILLKRDQWLEYCAEQAVRMHGRHLAPWLQMLRSKRDQPDYAVEYETVCQTLASPDGFSMPQPLIDSVLNRYDVTKPAQNALTIAAFDVNPEQISAGGSATLTWSVEGAAKVTIGPGIGAVSVSGTRTVIPDASTAYTLTATAPGGRSEQRTTQVSVSAPLVLAVIESFAAAPLQASPGQTVTLEWKTRDAQRVSIGPEPGDVAAEGKVEVRPAGSTTYELSAWGSDGVPASCSATVTVVAPPPSAGQAWFRETVAATLDEPVERLLLMPRTGSVFALGRGGALFCRRAGDGGQWSFRHPVPVRGLSLAPDRRRVVTADWNGALRCFDEADGGPVWEAAVPGVPSGLAAGRWQGQDGLFVATWRKGTYFCNAGGAARPISATEFTVRTLCVRSPEGCFTGDAEGGVWRFGPAAKRGSLREPVRSIVAGPPGAGVIVLTVRDHVFALDDDLRVLSFGATNGDVRAWAASGNSLVYANDAGVAYRLTLGPPGEKARLQESMCGPSPAGCAELAASGDGRCLVLRDRSGELAFQIDGQVLEEPPQAAAAVIAVDSFGFHVATAAGAGIHVFENRHTLERCRPARIVAAFEASLVLGRSAIATVSLTNAGQRPASGVRCEVQGRFAKPVVVEVPSLLPGETVALRRDTEPAIGGSFTLGAAIRWTDPLAGLQEMADELGIVEVSRNE